MKLDVLLNVPLDSFRLTTAYTIVLNVFGVPAKRDDTGEIVLTLEEATAEEVRRLVSQRQNHSSFIVSHLALVPKSDDFAIQLSETYLARFANTRESIPVFTAKDLADLKNGALSVRFRGDV